jgi:hypothetical protein
MLPESAPGGWPDFNGRKLTNGKYRFNDQHGRQFRLVNHSGVKPPQLSLNSKKFFISPAFQAIVGQIASPIHRTQ